MITAETLRRRFRLGPILDTSPDAGLPNDQNIAEPIDVAALQVTPSGLVGPRGRDTSGQRVEITPGLPPTMEPGGWGRTRLHPKENAYPDRIPGQMTRSEMIIPAANSGLIVDRQMAHPVHGFIVDNWTNIYLYIPALSLYVPPFTIRLAQPVDAAFLSVRVVAEAPPGYVQPALSANGLGFTFIATEDTSVYSAGIIAQGHP